MAIVCNSHNILQVSHIFFSKLDYFLVSNLLVKTICDCTIIPEFKLDHSIVTISMLFTNRLWWPGHSKINNRIVYQSEYQEQIKIQLVKQLPIM